MDEKALEPLLERLHGLLDRLEARLPPASPAPLDLALAPAWRWRSGHNRQGVLEPVPFPATIALQDLLGLDRQKVILERNTRQFLAGLPANNALLWGARGPGKSSLVKALLGAYAPQGLRLIEVGKAQLDELPDLLGQLHGRPQRCILFCDDLSFSSDETGYQHL
jgi:predicted AAA+ superfamily ATPase